MRFFAFLIALVFLSSHAIADQSDDFNRLSQGLTIDRSIGYTLVGSTRDSSRPWSLYLSEDGQALFTFSSGNTAKASWEKTSRNVICFKGLIEDDPEKPICKYAPPRGRGMDWVTVEKSEKSGKWEWVEEGARYGTTQFAFAFRGKTEINRETSLSNAGQWAGHVVLFRLPKTKQTYAIYFGNDKTWRKTDPKGLTSFGTYRIKDGDMCMTEASQNAKQICYRPKAAEGMVEWRRKGFSTARAEVLYRHPISIDATNTPVLSDALTKNWAHMVSYAQGSSLLAFVNYGGSGRSKSIDIHDALSGEYLSSFKGFARDIAFDKEGKHLAASDKTALRLLWPEAGVTLWEVKSTEQDIFTEVAFNDRGDEVIAGLTHGDVVVFNSSTGEEIDRAPFGYAAISDLTANDTYIFAAHKSGLILAAPRKEMKKLSTIKPESVGVLNLHLTPDGLLIATYRNGVIAEISMSAESGLTLERSRSVGMDKIKSTTFDKSMSRLVVFGDQTAKMLHWPSLKPVEGVDLTTLGQQLFGTFLSSDQLLTSVSRRFGAEIWSLNQQAALARYRNAMDNKSAAYQRTKTRDRLAKEHAAAQKAIIDQADRLFQQGDCTGFEQYLTEKRLTDARSTDDCKAALNKKLARADVLELIKSERCDRANELAKSSGLSMLREINQCKKAKAKRLEDERYQAAVASNDCETLDQMGPKRGQKDAGTNCRMAKAMESTSGQTVYLAAIRFDTTGDKARAKLLYLHIMEKFSSDAVAIDAANRLTALADLELMQKNQAENAKALAAAQKAMEAARKEAARAAKREAEARQRARDADRRAEEERRRADQARRQATSQPKRNRSCDHVYVGKEFQARGGALMLKQYYIVVGVSQYNGVATIRSKHSDYRQEVNCRSIP